VSEKHIRAENLFYLADSALLHLAGDILYEGCPVPISALIVAFQFRVDWFSIASPSQMHVTNNG
jgi:hypothetical protein